MFLLGTLVNTAAVILGSLIGLVLPRIPERMKTTAMHGMALAVMLIGLGMALSDQSDILLIIVSLVLGGVLGEWLHIEGCLERLGQAVQRRIRRQGDNQVAQAFVAASLLFCVGSMAIVGAIQSGAQHHHDTLYAKSVLDGFTSIIFTSTLGFGVILAAIPVFLYEGIIATLAYYAGTAMNSPAIISCMTAAGGLLVFAIGINMIGKTKIAVGNLLPSIFIAALLKWCVQAAGLHL